MKKKTLSILFKKLADLRNSPERQMPNDAQDAISQSRHPNFKAWGKNGIMSSELGHTIAPEDYYEYDENGKKRTVFSLDETLIIEETILRPNGWRIMNRHDWYESKNEFSVDRQGHKNLCRFLRKLNFNPDTDANGIVVVDPMNHEKVGKFSRYWIPPYFLKGPQGAAMCLAGENLLKHYADQEMQISRSEAYKEHYYFSFRFLFKQQQVSRKMKNHIRCISLG